MNPIQPAWYSVGKPSPDPIARLPRWGERIATIGVDADDSDDARLRKASLTLLVAAIVGLAAVWVAIYAGLGLYVSAAIPFAYQIVSVASLFAVARTRFDRFRMLQLTLLLLLPAMLHLSLGGFSASSGVMLWSFAAPVGALIFASRPRPWFVGWLLMVVTLGVVEPLLDPAPIPTGVRVAFFVLNLSGVSGVVWLVLRYYIRGSAREREKSDRLLLNVLPAPIARRLKSGERPLADRFDEVAVLFADLVDFTPLSERLTPEETVEWLDGLFSAFDEVTERLGLEKIKTVGDAYMVVAGLPEPQVDAAGAIAEMALELQSLMVDHSSPKGPVRLRIGVDVGPVVAGVIGTHKFAYDLWGDVVNTASRMESHGVPGRIQVTPRVKERLDGSYLFEPRGVVEVKGKGTMETYFLVGRLEVSPRATVAEG